MTPIEVRSTTAESPRHSNVTLQTSNCAFGREEAFVTKHQWNCLLRTLETFQPAIVTSVSRDFHATQPLISRMRIARSRESPLTQRVASDNIMTRCAVSLDCGKLSPEPRTHTYTPLRNGL